MKRVLLLLLFLIPLQIFAVSNLKLNGAASTTITSFPADIVMTCDLASNGNSAQVEVYLDLEGNGVLNATDQIIDYSVITDGIGWITYPPDRDEDIIGDETGVNGKLQSTLSLSNDLDILTAGTFIVKVIDANGSTAQAILNVNIQPTPPYITGTVTDENDGTPVALAIVWAESQSDEYADGAGITDANGNYFINVEPGTYKVSATSYLASTHQPSDSTNVTVGEGETKTVNIQMPPYTSYVEGYVKTEAGVGVPGIMLWVYGTDLTSLFSSFTFTNESGYYKVGVMPGEVAVGAPLFIQEDISSDYYIDPSVDTLTVNEGQTATANFTAKQYTTFITGTCKVGETPLAGVELYATAINMSTFEFNIYSAVSGADGTYKMGIKPGNIQALMAEKDGYTLSDPANGYFSLSVSEGQTLENQNFGFTAESDVNSISGQVTFENGSPAANVYVVAIDDYDESATSYRIQYTDANGNFSFIGLDDGYWKVGVYKDGYYTDPYMLFYDIWYSGELTGADFVLKEGRPTGIGDLADSASPEAFQLSQNYPNPFNLRTGATATQIRFSLNTHKNVDVSIFNINGQLVHKAHLGQMTSGIHSFQWDGRDMSGSVVPSGTYFYRFKAGDQVLTKQMMIIK